MSFWKKCHSQRFCDTTLEVECVSHWSHEIFRKLQFLLHTVLSLSCNVMCKLLILAPWVNRHLDNSNNFRSTSELIQTSLIPVVHHLLLKQQLHLKCRLLQH